jgi:tRNA A-37 threonylcarbamoyl transferase component Bud32
MTANRTCPECQTPLPADAPAGLCPRCLLQRGVGSDTSGTTTGFGPFTPPSVDELRPLFPQLEIIELLGQGGMGAVYKARQPGLDRLVALKVLPRRDDAAFAERFTREARALAKLNHPGIVTVHDFGQVGELYYFVMEYVDGVNLRQAEAAGKLAPAEALTIVPQICAALQFAHDANVVHRDIKPENILLDAKGRVKIADFGLAKLLDRDTKQSHLTGTHQAMGTMHYMAPEQWEKPLTVDHRADIYSLGVVFYELLTGELPLGRFAAPSQKVQVDVRIDDVVLRTLEKEPDRRYQHASDVKTDVERIGGMLDDKLTFDEIPVVLKQLKERQKKLRDVWSTLALKNAPTYRVVALFGMVMLCVAGVGFFLVHELYRSVAEGAYRSDGPWLPYKVITAWLIAGIFIGIVVFFVRRIRGTGNYEDEWYPPSLARQVDLPMAIPAGIWIAVSFFPLAETTRVFVNSVGLFGLPVLYLILFARWYFRFRASRSSSSSAPSAAAQPTRMSQLATQLWTWFWLAWLAIGPTYFVINLLSPTPSRFTPSQMRNLLINWRWSRVDSILVFHADGIVEEDRTLHDIERNQVRLRGHYRWLNAEWIELTIGGERPQQYRVSSTFDQTGVRLELMDEDGLMQSFKGVQ